MHENPALVDNCALSFWKFTDEQKCSQIDRLKWMNLYHKFRKVSPIKWISPTTGFRLHFVCILKKFGFRNQSENWDTKKDRNSFRRNGRWRSLNVCKRFGKTKTEEEKILAPYAPHLIPLHTVEQSTGLKPGMGRYFRANKNRHRQKLISDCISLNTSAWRVSCTSSRLYAESSEFRFHFLDLVQNEF